MNRLPVPLLLVAISCLFLDLSYPAAESSGTGTAVVSGEIAFASSRGGVWQLWTVNPDGGHLRQVTRGTQDFHYPAWHPNGRELACADNSGRIVIVDGNGSLEVLPDLPRNCTHPSWAPDGGMLVFVCHTFEPGGEDSDLWLLDLKQYKLKKLAELPDVQNYPDWSPDGSAIVYTSGRRESAAKVVEELWVVDVDGSNPRRLLANGFSNIHPKWSPDGKRIAFASNKTGNMEIWVMAADGRNPMRLTFDRAYDANPTWSPDGSRIGFASTRSGRMELWTMAAWGADTKQLTGLGEAEGESLEPAWRR